VKKLLISLGVGTVLWPVFAILAGMGGAACHCNTPLQVLFPFMSMLGVHTDTPLRTALWVSQLPIYLAAVTAPQKAEWKCALALAILVIHFVAVALAMSVP
jgi:hypothetical protein